jgi:hypothetical protein
MLDCCSFPPDRLPVHFVTGPGLPDNLLGPMLAGVSWWSSDPESHLDQVWDGPGAHGSLDTCSGVSFIAVDNLRAKYGEDIRGIANYCADDEGITELHAFVDATIDYPLAQVAAHEWGHGIGFGHSHDPSAVMYAYVNGAGGLGPDDLAGLRTLYPGAFALDVAPSDVEPLTFGTKREVDVSARVVGGMPCDPAQMRLQFVGGHPLLKLSGPAVAGDGTLGLERDANDPRTCRGRFGVELTEPSGGATSLTIAPAGAIEGQPRQVYVPLNNVPAAQFTIAPQTPTAGEWITLMSSSFDTDGDGISQSWDVDGDGSFDDESGPTASVRLPAGSHTISLRVSDGWAQATTTETVIVKEPAPATNTGPGSSPGPGAPPATDTRPPISAGSRPPAPAPSHDVRGEVETPLAIVGSKRLRRLAPRVAISGERDTLATVSVYVSRRVARQLGLRSTRVAFRELFLRDGVTIVRLRLNRRVRLLAARKRIAARLRVESNAGETVYRRVILVR